MRFLAVLYVTLVSLLGFVSEVRALNVHETIERKRVSIDKVDVQTYMKKKLELLITPSATEGKATLTETPDWKMTQTATPTPTASSSPTATK